MIFIDKETKQDPEARWNLPDETFFAAGACQVLAYAFLQKYPREGFKPLWIRPHEGFRGNHIIVSNGLFVFDYGGIQGYDEFFANLKLEMRERALHDDRFGGWDFELVEFPVEFLISEDDSKNFGLWLRQPDQFLHDALPRAYQYLEKFEHEILRVLGK